MNRKNIKLWALILTAALLITGGVISASAATMGSETGSVCVGGMPFGVKFYTEGILVVGFCDVDVNSAGGGCRNVNPARDAGLKIKDVIVEQDNALNYPVPMGQMKQSAEYLKEIF